MSGTYPRNNYSLLQLLLIVVGILTAHVSFSAYAVEGTFPSSKSVLDWWDMAKTLGSLLLVLLIFFVFVLIYKRYSPGAHAPDSDLTILSSVRIGSKEKLIVVRYGSQKLLLGVTQTSINSLSIRKNEVFSVDVDSGVSAEIE